MNKVSILVDPKLKAKVKKQTKKYQFKTPGQFIEAMTKISKDYEPEIEDIRQTILRRKK